jgi:hypothetical protein
MGVDHHHEYTGDHNSSWTNRFFYFLEVQLIEDPVGAWSFLAPVLIVFVAFSGGFTYFLMQAIDKEQAEFAKLKKDS